MFTEKDQAQFASKGISIQLIEQQLDNFKTGFPFLHVYRAASVNDGIWKIGIDDQIRFLDDYTYFTGTRVKFVPASGAASRMFKSLYEALEQLTANEKPEGEVATDLDWSEKSLLPAAEFFANLSKFAFYPELKPTIDFHSMDESKLTDAHKKLILEELLLEDGLNYGSSPKGLLSFHAYKDGARTPFEEHLVEAALYGQDAYGVANLHLTVSPEHREGFETLFAQVKAKYETQFKVKYQIQFSEQMSATDTIAVNLDGTPFRDKDDTILFRPAGHGALLSNLNQVESELIFIKNIDNVVNQNKLTSTIHWKKVLSSFLLKIRNQCFEYLREMDKGQLDPNRLENIRLFINMHFGTTIESLSDSKLFQAQLHQQLHRPIRVCGMVVNVGEPGGGPFIANNADGKASLQIAESSQINQDDPEQKNIMLSATHFNPVDLILSPMDYQGKKFNLLDFSDPATGFISVKTKDGKELKAQELPGLWNGAMSNWNTIFVEVPLETFNPVKTVNDLLRPEHN